MVAETRTLIEFSDIYAVEIECAACRAVMSFNGKIPALMTQPELRCIQCSAAMDDHSLTLIKEVLRTIHRAQDFKSKGFGVRLVVRGD